MLYVKTLGEARKPSSKTSWGNFINNENTRKARKVSKIVLIVLWWIKLKQLLIEKMVFDNIRT